MDNIDNITNLLNQIGVIREKNAEILEASGGMFNMFQVCRVDRRETIHSAIIAEFLNPKGSHGLKHKFLECFIAKTLGNDFKDVFNFKEARLYTEHQIPSGRFDIYIEDNSHPKNVIIIENKTNYDDQSGEQLEKYYIWAEDKSAKNEIKNFRLIYLTPNGDDIVFKNGEEADFDYIPISYRDNLIEWLEGCVSIAARFPLVRETIVQYINLVKKLTNQDMDTKNKEEIVNKIVGNPDFLESAQYIQEIWNDCKRQVCKNLQTEIEKTAKEFGLFRSNRADYNDVGNSDGGVRVDLKRDNWDFCIAIHHWGINTKGKNFGVVISIGYEGSMLGDTYDKLIECTRDAKIKRHDHDYECINFEEIFEPCWAKAQRMLDEKENFVYKTVKYILEVLEQKFFNQAT